MADENASEKQLANELRLQRDADLIQDFNTMSKDMPWAGTEAIYKMLSAKYYKTPRTVHAIVSGEYERNLKKRMQEQQDDPKQYKLFDALDAKTQSPEGATE